MVVYSAAGAIGGATLQHPACSPDVRRRPSAHTHTRTRTQRKRTHTHLRTHTRTHTHAHTRTHARAHAHRLTDCTYTEVLLDLNIITITVIFTEQRLDG